MAEPALEIANAYIALYAKMPGIQRDIEKGLGGTDATKGAEKAGKSVGGKLMSTIGGIVKGGAIAVGAAGAAAVGIALTKGFQRLGAIDEARAKLTGLGNDGDAVAGIMQNALAAVRGTAFGMGDAATVAASLVAANIKPGEQLQGVLKSVANSAAAAGVGLGEMGSIYAKVASTGKAQNDVLQQVADRGIPIYQKLAEQLGVTTEEVFKMASAGKIGFAEFQAAMTAASGTVADEMGKTLSGATSNLFAALGRIGAGLLGGIYPYLAPLVQAITAALGPIETRAAEIGTAIGNFISPGLQWLTDTLNSGLDLSGFFDMATAFSPLMLIFKAIQPILPDIMAALKDIGQVIVSTVLPAIKTLLPTLASALIPIFAEVIQAILPIISAVLPVLADLLATLAPIVLQVVDAILPLITAVLGLISPLVNALAPVFETIIALLQPIIEAILPVLMTLIDTLAPIVMQLVNAFLPLLEPILALITPLLSLISTILPPLMELLSVLITYAIKPLEFALAALLPAIQGVVGMLSDVLAPVITYVQQFLQGLITFLTGVFTGNWKKAWEGMQQIVAAVWNGIVGIVKGVINGVISLINGMIGQVNGIGGALAGLTGGAVNVRIPTIPKLADGAVVANRPGGILANIGEGRYPEAVIPLSPPVLAQLGGGDSGGVHFHGPVYTVDADELGEEIQKRKRRANAAAGIGRVMV